VLGVKVAGSGGGCRTGVVNYRWIGVVPKRWNPATVVVKWRFLPKREAVVELKEIK